MAISSTPGPSLSSYSQQQEQTVAISRQNAQQAAATYTRVGQTSSLTNVLNTAQKQGVQAGISLQQDMEQLVASVAAQRQKTDAINLKTRTSVNELA